MHNPVGVLDCLWLLEARMIGVVRLSPRSKRGERTRVGQSETPQGHSVPRVQGHR